MNGAALKSLQASTANPDLNRVTVLAVSSEKRDRAQLRQILSRTNWTVYEACSCSEAMSRIHDDAVAVLVCASELSDGTWQSLMDALHTVQLPPMIIVAADLDDGLWADVLQRGAYDFVCKPFRQQEVTRIISLAWLYWREKVAPSDVAKSQFRVAACA
jgi:DNA-binding NtrC family response regulator